MKRILMALCLLVGTFTVAHAWDDYSVSLNGLSREQKEEIMKQSVTIDGHTLRFEETETSNIKPIIKVLVPYVVFFFLLWLGGLYAWPRYNVWKSHKDGEADLARAKNEQNIQIAEAQSRLNAAELNKKAAIIEASAVAEQIKSIGENLQHHDLYLKWQWIKMMEDRKGSTIYVPTEAGLPILEANRLSKDDKRGVV